jgi:kynurenine 3-monooxygenase
MVKTDRFDYSQSFIEHGYKEFHIAPGPDGQWKMASKALHIWPRGHFMMIALPNPDGSFTCTLFFPFEGLPSFQSLETPKDVEEFFRFYFKDLIPLMPGFNDQFFNHPTSSLVTIKCFPWLRGNTMLVGDAAHAIVPFYGQGMNCGFEDIRILGDMLDQTDDWNAALAAFQFHRKVDTDAISEISLANFIEMRDSVANPAFLLRKKIEALLHKLNPVEWIPRYTMVTFSNMPYSEALERGKWQDAILDMIMEDEDLPDLLRTEGYEYTLWDRYVQPAIDELHRIEEEEGGMVEVR